MTLVIRKLIVDERNVLFDAQGMKYVEFQSDFAKIREYAAWVLREAPPVFREGKLLEQQLSEIIKNGIKHGNKSDSNRKLRIWYDLRKRARFIIEDEGDGFTELDKWNEFFRERQIALHNQDFTRFMNLASYRGTNSTEDDGGNSLIAALEYWNGGMIFNAKRNKVGVVRWFGAAS